MIDIRRILCPIDFSDFSRRALDHAIAIAQWYESTVTALYVFTPAPVAAYATGPIALEPLGLTAEDRRQMLADARHFVDEQTPAGFPVEAVIREGSPVTEILDQAASMNADLLVIGTHGRSGFERLFLGSVTERVLRKAGCPVLTVPCRLPDAVPARPVCYKRILCAVDFSDSSLHALNYALSVAQEADGQLTVLHVVSHEFDNAMDAAATVLAGDRMTVDDFKRQREDALRQRLQSSIPEAVAAYCTVDSMMPHGKPWREILRVASERQSDLIVMGVQGRGAADLFLFGSTAQHVVRESTCPVLTLRQGR